VLKKKRYGVHKKKKEKKRAVGQSKLMGSFAFISNNICFFSGHSRHKATYRCFLEEESRDKARTGYLKNKKLESKDLYGVGREL